MPLKSKQEFNKYMSNYLKKRYQERRKEIMALLGNKCSKCGTEGTLKIKRMNEFAKPLNSFWNQSMEHVLENIKNLALFCVSCYTKKKPPKNDSFPLL
jgi:hypothetical protein